MFTFVVFKCANITKLCTFSKFMDKDKQKKKKLLIKKIKAMTKSDVFKANIEAYHIFKQHDTMLTVDECGAYLKIHCNTVKNRIDKGIISAVFQGGKYHIPKIQFIDKLTNHLEVSSTVRLLIEDTIKSLTIFNAHATVFTVEGCASYLKVTPRTVKNRIESNTIEAVLRDRKYYIPKLQFLQQLTEDFEEAIEQAV